MTQRSESSIALTLGAALLLGVAALSTWAAYAALPSRSFVADDFEWLLRVAGRSGGEVVRLAFDTSKQSHFYRPLVWLLIWAQTSALGLAAGGFHLTSMALHGLCAWLTGGLTLRLARRGGVARGRGMAAATGTTLLAALHPAPFEAVTWISAQADLLAALLLLLAAHCWLGRGWLRVLGATLCLAGALLAKETAVVGAALLLLLPIADSWRLTARRAAWPLAATAVYLLISWPVIARNGLAQAGSYGAGPQVVLNPLRSLGLLAAPLTGSERGDAWWLIPCGMGGAAALLAICWRWRVWRAPLALGAALLPTAPFASAPDSRYLYLPALVFAALVGMAVLRSAAPRYAGPDGRSREQGAAPAGARQTARFRQIGAAAIALALALWGAGELRAREAQFAAAGGAGGSLFALVSAICADSAPRRIVIVDAPLAPQHAEAIVALRCPKTKARPIDRAHVDDVLRDNTVVVGFSGGAAQIERRID